MARVRALRRLTEQSSAVLTIGDVALDTRVSRVLQAGVRWISHRWNLAAAIPYAPHGSGRTQIELTEHIYAQDIERDSNSIEVLVARLRRKLGAEFVRDLAWVWVLRG